MFCKNCGGKVAHSDAEHCSDCGAKIRQGSNTKDLFWGKTVNTARWKKGTIIISCVLFVVLSSFGLASAKYGYKNITSLVLHGHFEQDLGKNTSNPSNDTASLQNETQNTDSSTDPLSDLTGSNQKSISNTSVGNTGSKSSSGSGSQQSGQGTKPTCDSAIVAMPSTVEMNQKVTLMAIEMLADSVSWSGGGSFEDANKSNTTWSSNVGGNYSLTLTAKNKSGECSSSAKVTVSGNLNRIDGLSYVRSYSASNNGIAIYFDIFYLDQNGTVLTNRTTTMPISASVSIYKNVSGAKGDRVYNNSFSNSQITTSGYRRITIPVNQINSSQVKDLIVEYTINTPEQGSFSTSFNIY